MCSFSIFCLKFLSTPPNSFLSRNRLSGNIPSEFGDLADLSWLYVFLYFPFSSLLWVLLLYVLAILSSCRLLLLYRSLFKNFLNGNIPTELGNLLSLTRLYVFLLLYFHENGDFVLLFINKRLFFNRDLEQNRFSGEIPTELGNIVSFESLYVIFYIIDMYS